MKIKLSFFLLFIYHTICFGQVLNSRNLTNIKYKTQIDSIAIIDQNVRSSKYIKAMRYYYKHKNSSEIFKQKRKYKRATNLVHNWEISDSLNINKLLGLIKKYGFPSKSKVGNYSYQSAIVILMHFDKDRQNKVLKPILLKALLKNEILPIDFATIIDRHLINNGEKSIYYSYEPCSFLSLSEKEKKEVLNLRHKIGLYGFKFKCGLFHKWNIIENEDSRNK